MRDVEVAVGKPHRVVDETRSIGSGGVQILLHLRVGEVERHAVGVREVAAHEEYVEPPLAHRHMPEDVLLEEAEAPTALARDGGPSHRHAGRARECDAMWKIGVVLDGEHRGLYSERSSSWAIHRSCESMSIDR